MKKTLFAIIALIVLAGLACQTPTVPFDPGPPPPKPKPPVIAYFTTEASSPYGQITIRFCVCNVSEGAPGMSVRLGTGPRNSDLIVFVDPYNFFGSGNLNWVTWILPDQSTAPALVYIGTKLPIVTTTYTLTATNKDGTVTDSRTVTVQ
jgi:hypothetical protein